MVLALTLASCGAGAPTYAACVDDLDCAEMEDTCYRLIFDRIDGTTGDGNLCTRGCVSDADCGADGVCLSLVGDPSARFFCASQCTTSADCYAGFVCSTVAGMDLGLCLP